MSTDSTTSAEEFTPAVISDNASVVLEKRYLQKNGAGDLVENPEGMFRRVAKALAAPEFKYEKTPEEVAAIEESFFQMMASLEYLPNSPTMMNAGTGAGTLSACFVLPLTDSMEGIMGAAHDAAMVQKFGGGTGFALSELRPTGASIATTHGKACGPIQVLRHLSSVSTLVTQGGKRDGANMAVMDVHHPDILEFIDCKQVEGEIHNFNISVGASDEFMQAVKDDTTYALRALREPSNPDSGMVEVDRLNAREVFSKIVYGAWRNGEPGMIFLDEVNRNSPVIHLGRITATNPCGEQPLLPNESCNLGSIDVAKFLETDEAGMTDLNWNRLGETVKTATRMLDNVIDANKYAVPAIEEMTQSTRKLGLGLMGFADMLVELGIPYDTEEAVELGRKLMAFIRDHADQESMAMAEERGAFPAWHDSEAAKRGDKPYRNACRLTVAPTGTISMIAGASSGIEPIFALAFRKQNILGGETLYYVDKNFERISKERGFYSEDLLEHLSDGGSLQDRDDVPDDVKRLFHVASDISPRDHVLMQAAFQESTDAGISKTVNFPNEATVEDVEDAYLLAWETHCKGITVYRAGSRDKEVLTTGTSENAQAEASADENTIGIPQYIAPKERPAMLNGITRRVRTGRGNLFVTVNMASDGRPFEVFATHGKAGGNDAAMAEAVSRMASLSLRSGIDPIDVSEQLRGITDVPAWDEGEMIRSVPDAIASVLDRINAEASALPTQEELTESESSQAGMFNAPTPKELGMPTAQAVPMMGQEEKVAVPAGAMTGELCPECSSTVAHVEGCLKCFSCGYSKC
ncbi:vitamin B12-dependent ribonucleotide reductase [Candidatus Lucifugimonas marina]|jgi:ribonucleoside-diphosphate reductase alpha chain|uniref:Vitamin B12-dependent ribonucleotide reductase n=2 Tax=Candidatus Lucifugimonas marina TaxID=3038979 RepID=A0AAJ6CUP4_9CHLR|nr:vitamin B12-dependent ribonucleotide reductase [SAR202 cluster bacterium JH702]MDG0869173.1 vitamin B12-dependent ribonucleotide reductase [SAR202 cluster bacterium JH639]WFG36838.1 vitamin B12-dependent ribonucleotide reductase [SAR202 cluster bacterium JH545]WFG40777.1 vitamin B12-dependent ribonucleotide reductase [SAR202 cluster bacterium JH1073]